MLATPLPVLAFDPTPHLKSRGYEASIAKQKPQKILYERKVPFNLKITITEYSPLVQVGGSAYFFESFPFLGVNGLVLTKGDASRLRAWVDYHESIAKSKGGLAGQPKPPSANKQSEPVRGKSFGRKEAVKLDKIILDAGHGGHDPGSSAYGFLEKDLTLKITKDLQKSLRDMGSEAKVLMVRRRDRYVSLEERCNLANGYLKKGENGLFVSVHLNTWFHEGTRGFETYYLAHSSTIMEARIHSHIEDTSFDVGKTNTKSMDPYKVIFGRLEMVQYQKESKFVAQTIMEEVQKRNKGFSISRGVKSDLFYVLKGSLMPAILIEAGFISNRKDLEFLTDPKKRKSLTDSIAVGIVHYERQFRATEGFSHQFFTNE